MTTYFTADTHFGDISILRQRGHAFASIETHDATLIANWNEVVGPDDEIWHLGDFASGASRSRCREIFACLGGRKRLVQGNHDTNRVLDLAWTGPPVESLRTIVKDASGTERKLFLSHYAHRAWPGLWRGTRHLYGHSHAKIADTSRSCDVGVDAWGFRPVSLEAIIARQDTASLLPEDFEESRGRRSP